MYFAVACFGLLIIACKNEAAEQVIKNQKRFSAKPSSSGFVKRYIVITGVILIVGGIYYGIRTLIAR
jgi:hypothetical protein